MPKYLNTWLNICSAVSMAVGRFLSGIKRQDLENLSTMTRMYVLPSDTGRSVTKSTPRCDHGQLGTESGRSLPAGRWRRLFEMAHVVDTEVVAGAGGGVAVRIVHEFLEWIRPTHTESFC